jgi:small GTP-binding protein
MSDINCLKCKVIFVGDSSVGKSCIINRYINDSFQNQVVTLGCNSLLKTITIDKYNIKFDIWDTAGMEKFRSLNAQFYKDANIVILVYEIINLNSFNSIKNYWYKDIIENSNKNIILGLIGNKSDLYLDKEEVSEEEARNYAKEINAIFKLTSALNGNGINELFEILAKEYIKKYKNNMLIGNLNDNKPKLEKQILKKKTTKKFC